MTRFTPGKTYTVRSIGDYDCIFRFRVEARTDHFVTLRALGEDESAAPIRVKVSPYEGVEKCMPLGRYSMAPCLSADREEVLSVRPTYDELANAFWTFLAEASNDGMGGVDIPDEAAIARARAVLERSDTTNPYPEWRPA